MSLIIRGDNQLIELEPEPVIPRAMVGELFADGGARRRR